MVAHVSPSPAAASAVPSVSSAGGWWREPLLHFVLIGALLFGLDRWLIAGEDDPDTIVITAAVDEDAARLFESARGRAPDAEERRALRRVWLDNEVLYREGLALGVDRGDSAIRERVIFKALSLIDADLRVPEIGDEALRAWFEARREKYDRPARYDFEEATVSGPRSEAAVRALVARLAAADGAGDAGASLRRFTGRPRGSIVQSYGTAFADAVDAASPGVWQALPTGDGWRAIRVTAKQPAEAAQFEQVRGPVLQDWRDATASELRSAAVRRLAGRYTIRDEAGAAAR